MIQILSLVVWWFAIMCILRFLLQLSGANFYSPIISAITRLTNPVLQPLRKMLPPHSRVDFASLAAVLGLFILIKFLGAMIDPGGAIIALIPIVWTGLIAAVSTSVIVIIVSIFVTVILSWVVPNVYSPLADLARQLSEPVLAPFRKLLPAMAGFDFSPMLALLTLWIVLSLMNRLESWVLIVAS